ncbi:FHA domain-containing protein [Cohnella nanjingensis]|uniref:Winged helix-turn-helix domain-containing protein n=1 Tax=Cohnella nanjingensis TaxID=1387779 RepID=A0A7X0RKD3_9BACL|nr:FHA domain-containing protein [Cohnella nanjingensis]MBB6669087.1 winged helix-turn-helix domain-containing protein [Cohnella nanjingensis]
MHRSPCLIVERGYPYEGGTPLPLEAGSTLLGRRDEQWEPHIAFDNVYISRKQAEIRRENGEYTVTDLDSKHGTALNGHPLTPFRPAALRISDRIDLARGMVVLTFSPFRLDETMDFAPLIPQPFVQSGEYALDPVRQSVQVGDEAYPLSDKEYRCLELLVGKEQQFVPRDEIIRHVWPERADAPDASTVSAEEVHSLLYRIRKKTNQRLHIESIRGKGFILQDLAARTEPAKSASSPVGEG